MFSVQLEAQVKRVQLVYVELLELQDPPDRLVSQGGLGRLVRQVLEVTPVELVSQALRDPRVPPEFKACLVQEVQMDGQEVLETKETPEAPDSPEAPAALASPEIPDPLDPPDRSE